MFRSDRRLRTQDFERAPFSTASARLLVPIGWQVTDTSWCRGRG